MTRPPVSAALNTHAWDGNGVCQVHDGWCSMAPTVDLAAVDLDAPIPYLLTAAGLAVLDGPPAPDPTLAPAIAGPSLARRPIAGGHLIKE